MKPTKKENTKKNNNSKNSIEKKSMQEYWMNSHVSGGHLSYLDNLYDEFLSNPKKIPKEWSSYFKDLANGNDAFDEISHTEIIEHFKKNKAKKYVKNDISQIEGDFQKSLPVTLNGKVNYFIDSYRNFGHSSASLDPLGIEIKRIHKDLDYAERIISNEGDEQRVANDFPKGSRNKIFLKELKDEVRQKYSGNIGLEFYHLSSEKERNWIIDRHENSNYKNVSSEEKLYILKRLISARGLAKFLSAKYPGMKRFGIDGCETLIPVIDKLIQQTSKNGADQICFGMAHRGRLNLLINVLGKLPKDLFSEFEEDYDLNGSSTGDVKYHLGFSSNISTNDGDVHVSLINNPSHLEIVDPVVIGSVRARQDRLFDRDRNKVIPILIHGDAAFSGQGVVMETLQMSQTRSYGVGGTIHVVINNQIGFTTNNPKDARSTRYPTDIAKFIEAPIFHVNADDPEAALYVAKFAADYREKFKKDVVIDLVCYRRSGHNEADDPSSTQPLMYKAIKKQPSVLKQYKDNLIENDIINEDEFESNKKSYRSMIEKGKSVAFNLASKSNDDLWFDWDQYLEKNWQEEPNTCLSQKEIISDVKEINKIPDNFEIQKKVKKIFDQRLLMAKGEMKLNWGFSEIIAYSSLLREGYPIRFSGQDIRRGTFDHRHAVIFDQKTGETYYPLNKFADKGKTNIGIYDSILSEEAVLGFEYGYSATWPTGLVIWEAQFGDFVNGAQVVIDQFIVSAEQKWDRLSGLVMLLPHGFEGMGPEHSSARLERFLQLCAGNNIQICMPSNAAQIFHLLRRQAIRKIRRPLVVITPKSLLRMESACSDIDELTEGKFNNIIDDDLDDIDKVRRVVLCSGKIYHDLKKQRDLNNQKDVALIRLEQIYPFPYDEAEKILSKYNKKADYIWCQEEPRNQGAWYSQRHRLNRVLNKIGIKKDFMLKSRIPSAAPAGGLFKLHVEQQDKLVNETLGKG